MTREYANVWTRLASLLIDGFLQFLFFIPLYASMIIRGDEVYLGDASTSYILTMVFIWAAAMAFGIWNNWIRMGKTGQSLGRKFLNIAVLDEHGRPIGVGYAILRETIGRFLSGLVCYIGYLNAFWDSKNQMWHDKIANCYVYYVNDNFS